MPRPKRARHAPPVNNPKPPAPAATTTNEHDDDDDQRGRTRSRTRAARSTVTKKSLKEAEALRAALQSQDAALDCLATEDPTVTSGPEDNTRSSVEIGRRVVSTPSARRDTTGLDLADDSVFGDLGDSFADGHVPEAPYSGASSSATLSHLKTRPRSRQSSIIGRNDAPIRPSSRGGNTPGVSSSFNIGFFRRRAREPSILGASRRARSQTSSVAGSVTSSRPGSVARDSDSDSELDDGEGESAPEAESTPSKSRRQSRKSQIQNQRESPEHRRRSMRKRKSDDAAQSGSARPAKTSRVEANGGLAMGSDSELSELPSPSPPAARVARPVTPVNMDEIAAPPASSDSEADDNGIWPDIHTLAKKRRRPSATTPLHHIDDLSDVSTPPSLTHSPNLAAARVRDSAKQCQPSPKITTADLTSLLPKRTYKRIREDFDIDSDGAANPSGEEAPHEGTRPPRRRPGRPPGRANTVSNKAKHTPRGVRRSARTVSKTYRGSEDKENDSGDDPGDSHFQPLPDDTFDGSAVVPDVQNTDELLRASRKFSEVDQWELSYEEVAESSSPQGAR